MAKQQTKFLLTEGKNDAYAIAGLMANYVAWGKSEDEWPVKLEAAGSVEELLNPIYLGASFKRSGLEAIGILLDADEDSAVRWERCQVLCSAAFPGLPTVLPPNGLIHEAASGTRLGVWIMPDNRSSGMLETFLCYLVPQTRENVWKHAMLATKQAGELGAPFKAIHADKARIHTYLAWQDPPGRPLGEALKTDCLAAKSPAAGQFAQWFLDLFRLQGS